jgi:hypothetical protein
MQHHAAQEYDRSPAEGSTSRRAALSSASCPAAWGCPAYHGTPQRSPEIAASPYMRATRARPHMCICATLQGLRVFRHDHLTNILYSAL